MNDLIHAVNRIRNVPGTEMSARVKRVLVILGSSRSGSSLLKAVLAGHPDMASLDGEIEPFLTLTGNGFGHNSDSDALPVLSNKNKLLDNIFDDLSMASEKFPGTEHLKRKWEKRLLLQFPDVFSQPVAHDKLLAALDDALAEVGANDIRDERALQTRILSAVFRNTPWRMSYYDGAHQAGADTCFGETEKIEEPPFVLPRPYRRPFTVNDAETKVLLFKTPPDAYRIGMYEQLFPDAEISYLHLTRGYAQSVNGLMDGWLSPRGFFSHDLGRTGFPLNIEGYSDVVRFGKTWWKFDLPPNWREFTSARLEDVCLNQWLSPHAAILASGVPTLRIAFEDFLSCPAAVADKITGHLGLPAMALRRSLPVTMATDAPKARRWKKRAALLLPLGRRKPVGTMMETLGYSMDPETWL